MIIIVEQSAGRWGFENGIRNGTRTTDERITKIMTMESPNSIEIGLRVSYYDDGYLCTMY
jgi:hypothetical protein